MNLDEDIKILTREIVKAYSIKAYEMLPSEVECNYACNLASSVFISAMFQVLNFITKDDDEANERVKRMEEKVLEAITSCIDGTARKI